MAREKMSHAVGCGGVRKCDLVGTLISSENSPRAPRIQARIPSRAVLARKWPKLRLNRFTGRWIDDASGARGDDVESLLSYIAGRAS